MLTVRSVGPQRGGLRVPFGHNGAGLGQTFDSREDFGQLIVMILGFVVFERTAPHAAEEL